MTAPKDDYRNPDRREHFVYRAYNSHGVLVYVGCTRNPAQRYRQHKTNRAVWLTAKTRFRLTGPLPYGVARHMEHAALAGENPLYGWTPAKHLVGRAGGRSAVVTLTPYTPQGHSTARIKTKVAS